MNYFKNRFLNVKNLHHIYIYIYMMMPNFRQELGWNVWGSLGWTKTASGWNWRTSSGHLKMAAMLKTVGSDLKHFTVKTREKGGRRGLGPWPLRCLSQTLFL